MKKRVYSLTAASLAAVVVFATNHPVCASDTQTLDPVQKSSGNTPNGLAQNPTLTETKGVTTAKVNIDTQGVILKGYDAVAYFKQGKPVKGDPALASTYQGARYLFASASDKAEFDKDPAKYAPQYGGFCAYSLVNGTLADPEGSHAFVVYRDKLYLCGNEGALRGFKNEIERNIEEADSHWRQVTAGGD